MRIGIINSDTNICENIGLDDRPLSEIVLPDPYFAIDIDSTVAALYTQPEDSQELVLVEVVGQGRIGFTYENNKLIEPLPTQTAIPEHGSTTGLQNV